jgi:peroxiredoxin
MTELREFAQRSNDFEKLGVRIIGISVDDQEHAREAWEKAGAKKFTMLSDPGVKVIRLYGLLHEKGHGESDIALRTTLLIDPEGRESWRRVSNSVPDIPKADDTLADIKKAQEQRRNVDKGRSQRHSEANLH